MTTIGKPRPAKVLIVDDHPAVREALIARISKLSDLEVCGEAIDIPDALRLVAEHNPDIAIVDISLKTGNGLELIKQIVTEGAQTKVLVWSMHGEDLYAERAIRAGAMGYITKEHAMEQIISAIYEVLIGKIYLSPAMTEKLLQRSVGKGLRNLCSTPIDDLSDRELEVFRLIGQGLKTQEISSRLHLSIKTIETYRDRIRQKLQLKDGTELARHAIQWVVENH